MKNIKIYQSSKYNTGRYRIVNFIYFLDRKDNSYCIPMVGYLESEDNYTDILREICKKFDVGYTYNEVIKISNTEMLLFELRGTLGNLIQASDIIGKTIIPIYDKEFIVDLYIK